ncbi:ATP-binding protein [Streptomyces sp. NPDC048291]|uniref:ATP-binding protein n=1 Tax=Streptomyces sp. NPDC048291 TaxID=3365530 RepID=UPI00371776D3
MDLRQSPYSPSPGVRPAMLVGRDDVLEQFEITLDRLEAGRSGEAPLVTGSRGSGKTVLFNHMVSRARERGWFVGAEEAIPGTELSTLIALLARDVLMEMSGRHRFTDRVKRALGVLKAFASVSVAGVRLEINADAVAGTADTGIFDLDLRRLFIEIGEVARMHEIGVLFALDEVQTVPNSHLRVLHAALHQTAQRGLPIAFLGTGLSPSWQQSGAELIDPTRTTTYAARSATLSYTRLEPLGDVDTRAALTGPAEAEGVRFTEHALQAAVEFCEGSPWLVQFVGETAWGLAPSSPIDELAMHRALATVQERLNQTFFPRLLRHCDREERRILAAVAAYGGRNVPALRIGESSPHGDWFDEEFVKLLGGLARQDLIVLHFSTSLFETTDFAISLAVPRLAAYF